MDLVDPILQPLPNDEVLVVSRHSRRHPDGTVEPNATVLGPDGRERRRFGIGDGVADVQTTPDGWIWVAYTLQGTMGDFGRMGWGRLGPDEWVDPVGYSGVVAFDASGRRRLEYVPPEGLEIMNECCALNAQTGGAWACYHPGFPLVWIGADGRTAGWRTGLSDIEAVAVDGDRVLLAAAAGSHRGWRARLGLGRLDEVEELELQIDPPPERILGRGDALYAAAGGSWYTLTVAAAWAVRQEESTHA